LTLISSAGVGIAQAQPAPGAFAEVTAHWGPVPTVTQSASGALTAQQDAMVRNPFDPFTPEGALARASAMVSPAPGEKFVRSYTGLVGDTPQPGSPPGYATSTARVVTQWLVLSDGSVVQPGTSIFLDGNVSFTGNLVTNKGIENTLTEITATMNVYRGGNMTTVLQGGGQNLKAPANVNIISESGDFINHFSIPLPEGIVADLNFDESYDNFFSVNVGELFEIEFILSTHAECSNLILCDVRADFYNSGGFSLSLPEDVGGLTLTQIIPVPEPGISAMLGVGLCLAGLFVRRRK
jgi:hypothetical protein